MINLNKKTIGIDISDHAIQVVELIQEREGIKINNFGGKNIAPGIVEKGRIKDYDKLRQALRDALEKARLGAIGGRDIYAALPENQVYMHISEINLETGQQINEIVNKIIANTFPIDIKELSFTYKFSKTLTESNTLLIIAVRKKIINAWENFFNQAGLKIKVFDFEALATFRGLFSSWPDEPIGLLGIGASSTNFSIFNNTGIAYAYTLPEAGDFFTKQIAKELNLDEDKAEELKIKHGLSPSLSEPEAPLILKQCLDNLFKEIEQNITYFHKQHNKTVKRLYVYGGSSKLKGLREYLDKQDFVAEVKIASPRLGSDNLSQEYIGAIGLALRGIENKWSEIDPCLWPSRAARNKLNFVAGKLGAFKDLKNIYKIIFIIVLLFGVYFAVLALRPGKHKLPKADNFSNSSPVSSTSIPKKISDEKQEKKPQVKVKNIASSLNVRSGPGTSYKIINKVNPNEVFTLLGEEAGWYKILLNNNQEGWIFAGLSEKIE